MRKFSFALAVVTACFIFVVACKKQPAASSPDQSAISAETLGKIAALGFSSQNVRQTDDGYLVEGDIELTNELLNGVNDQRLLRVAGTEQYRTTNLVTALPRVITIKVTNLGTA